MQREFFSRSEVISLCAGRASGSNWQASGVSTDTRNIKAGDLFIALDGENFRGSDFLPEAQKQGAVAAVVNKFRPECGINQIETADSLLALRRLAAYHRRRYSNLQVVAITGSNGKTTTKELLAKILGSIAATHFTQGNLNNDVGVPLTLLGLLPEHRYAVVEIGASHKNDIARLMPAVAPDCVLVTNVAPAHLQGFGDLAGVIAAKSEIYRYSSATVILNADIEVFPTWQREFVARKQLSFSCSGAAAAAIKAQDIAPDGSFFSLQIGDKKEKIVWNLRGVHNVSNALGACACAKALGVEIEQMAAALQDFSLHNSRLVPINYGEHLFYDDTYNANPASFRAGIDLLAQSANSLLIAGKMGELGEDSAKLHREVAQYAQTMGIKRFWTLQAPEYGGENFESISELVSALSALLADPKEGRLTVLVKGSRSAKMERVFEYGKIKHPN